MRPWYRSRWLWLVAVVTMMPIGGILFVRFSVANVMHPALDRLSVIDLSARWSHPELLKIRKLGADAVPPLRRVLREKDRPTTRLLLWVKGKWPGVVKHFPKYPDPQKMAERRWTACQVLQTLGPAGKSAAPEIIKLLETGDISDSNAASMALWAIGIDAEISDQLGAALGRARSVSGRTQIIGALAAVKPPSVRTLQALTAALADPSPYVQCRAAETLGHLGVATPSAVSSLKNLQSTSNDELVVVDVSAALWNLEKDPAVVLPPIFRVLEQLLSKPLVTVPGGGNGGQGVSAGDQCFMAASEVFGKMALGETEKSKALGLLEGWCEKSQRIFVRMLLLPTMMELGFPKDKCFEVCSTGLAQQEDYYRIQAARLVMMVNEKYPEKELDVAELIRDRDLGVRVYAARIHWRTHRDAKVAVPVLIEALNRTRHQSYYYDIEILPAALRGLAEIGPAAQEAVSELDAVARDPNPAIAKGAAEALGKIRK